MPGWLATHECAQFRSWRMGERCLRTGQDALHQYFIAHRVSTEADVQALIHRQKGDGGNRRP